MRDDLGELPPGERVRLRRLALGLSQEEVAERSGLTQPNLSAIESGRRTLGPGVEGRL
ncbi:MAG TPA: helix-turn-helix transcriptional regulator, partial [Actinomycetales bacterium]|nr:helix-turn-helix transcriptional regulator [Actinomycetales bacterium]